jgi:large subunit ribosomal protein L18
MRIDHKRKLLIRRRRSIRKKLQGTAERPRMSVRFTGQHIYVQFIDDLVGATLAQVSTRARGVAGDGVPLAANVESATKIGKAAADAAREKGISSVVFDRSGARYHGKVKALADAAREAGLQF